MVTKSHFVHFLFFLFNIGSVKYLRLLLCSSRSIGRESLNGTRDNDLYYLVLSGWMVEPYMKVMADPQHKPMQMYKAIHLCFPLVQKAKTKNINQ